MIQFRDRREPLLACRVEDLGQAANFGKPMRLHCVIDCCNDARFIVGQLCHRRGLPESDKRRQRPLVRGKESLSQVMFKFTNYAMMFAPIGVGAAMAHTVGTQGLGVLLNLGQLILTLYLALVIFVIVVFGIVLLIARVPVRQFVRAVREPSIVARRTRCSVHALRHRRAQLHQLRIVRHQRALGMHAAGTDRARDADVGPGETNGSR